MKLKRGGPKSDAPRRDDLPVVSSVTLQREDRVNRDTAVVELMLGDCFFTVRMGQLKFPNGGFWSLFVCPTCGRTARILRLLGERLTCQRCDGLLYRSQLDNRPDRRTHNPHMVNDAIDRVMASMDYSAWHNPKIRALRHLAIKQREYRLKGYRAYFDPVKRKHRRSRKKIET
jgi:hypothetical protein